MKLTQISRQDTLVQSVIRQMMVFASVLEYAEWYQVVGNADNTRKTSSASGGQFRAANQDYPANPVTPDYASVVLKIFGDVVQVDKAFERRGLDLPSVRARDLMKFASNFGKNFQDKFFNGTGTNNEVTGLKILVPGSQVITAGTNGFDVPLGNSDTAKTKQQKFLELLDQLIESVDGGAQVIFANTYLISRLNSIAREFIRYEVSEFGTRIPFYNNVPLLNAGFKPDGSLVIPNNETVGTANDCTSVYAVRFGEAQDLSLATNIGLDVVDQGLVGNFYVHRVEFDWENALLNPKAVARLKGIRLT